MDCNNLIIVRTPGLIRGLELKAAVHRLVFRLVVLVHQVQLAVAQCHSFLVVPGHHLDRRERRRRRRALLALRLRLREVWPPPGRGAVRGR